MLQSSLSGNCRISVICTICVENLEESHNTLKFAKRIKNIKSEPIVNSVIDEQALIQQYKKEIQDLRHQLDQVIIVEKEKTIVETMLVAERQKFKDELHKAHLVRLTLKERIDHLTNMILSSQTVSEDKLLDWTAPSDVFLFNIECSCISYNSRITSKSEFTGFE